MSAKNHKMVDGRLLQMNKKFSALKEKQKTKIAEWFYEAYRKCYLDSGKIPGKKEETEIMSYVFDKVEEAQIWIPAGELYRYYHGRRSKLLKRLEKEFSKEEKQNESNIDSI